MPAPPRRKRFQIHLSTAVVMMLVAAVLVWANMTERYLHNPPTNLFQSKFVLYGWPLDAVAKFQGDMKGPILEELDSESSDLLRGRPMIAILNVLIDAAVGFSIILAAWWVAERIIRHPTRKGTLE
jgi:hypothetical protein